MGALGIVPPRLSDVGFGVLAGVGMLLGSGAATVIVRKLAETMLGHPVLLPNRTPISIRARGWHLTVWWSW